MNMVTVNETVVKKGFELGIFSSTHESCEDALADWEGVDDE